MVAKGTCLQSGDRNNVVNRRNESFHTPVTVNLGHSLFEKIGVRRIHHRPLVIGNKFPSLWWALGDGSTSEGGNDVTDIERIVELSKISILVVLKHEE